MYTIGQVAEMFHLPISTLRYYDKEGLFPNLERKGNIRQFSDTELFEKASNINGFQGGRVANNLYISPFWATVFQTAAFFYTQIQVS